MNKNKKIKMITRRLGSIEDALDNILERMDRTDRALHQWDEARAEEEGDDSTLFSFQYSREEIDVPHIKRWAVRVNSNGWLNGNVDVVTDFSKARLFETKSIAEGYAEMNPVERELCEFRITAPVNEWAKMP
mgnify:CR=1 FL=1|tara:strand:- start:491 stop:886 length:396 start_codon:yes stop_codon:yes gene_type:complete